MERKIELGILYLISEKKKSVMRFHVQYFNTVVAFCIVNIYIKKIR